MPDTPKKIKNWKGATYDGYPTEYLTKLKADNRTNRHVLKIMIPEKEFIVHADDYGHLSGWSMDGHDRNRFYIKPAPLKAIVWLLVLVHHGKLICDWEETLSQEECPSDEEAANIIKRDWENSTFVEWRKVVLEY